MKNKTSPLYSLADPFEYKPHKLNAFESLGDAALGEYHIAVFFRNIVSTQLIVDHANPVRPTKFCTLYNIQNSRGTLYGILFVVPAEGFRINGGVLTVKGNKDGGAFAAYPFSDDKRNLSIYVDNNDNLLANLGNVEYSKLVVFDET